MTVFDTAGQTTQPTTITRMPRVDLMPPEIAEAARFRRFQLAMGAALAGAVAIAGFLYVHEKGGVADAQSQLDAQQAQTTVLQAQLAQLQSVSATYAEVQAKEQLLALATAGEIRWSYYLTDLGLKMPDNVWLTELQASEGADASTGAAVPTTGVTATGSIPIGSIDFSGMAFKHDDVATWLDVLGKEPGFINPYFTNSTRADDSGSRALVNFDSSTQLSDEAPSYTHPAGN